MARREAEGLRWLAEAGALETGRPIASASRGSPQHNVQSDDWACFYGEQRLRPLLRRALDA